MKKLSSLLTIIVLVLSLAACSGTAADVNAQTVELNVFAAASLTGTLNQITENYKAVAPKITVTLTFDSSGTLKTQIAEGADCDVFISAAQKQMNQLDITSDKNTDGLDFILAESRVNLLENKVVLAVPAGNPAGIYSFDDLAGNAVSLIALGNPDVPVGQYAEEILTGMGLWESLQSKITFGSDVKEVTAWLDEHVADCGIVYSTDALTAGLDIAAYAAADMLATPVVYPAAVLKNSKHATAAREFLDYLQSEAGDSVFVAAGFTLPD